MCCQLRTKRNCWKNQITGRRPLLGESPRLRIPHVPLMIFSSKHIGSFEVQTFFPWSCSNIGKFPQINILYVQEKKEERERDWSSIELSKEGELWETFSALPLKISSLSSLLIPFLPACLRFFPPSFQQTLSLPQDQAKSLSVKALLSEKSQNSFPSSQLPSQRSWHTWNFYKKISCLRWLTVYCKPHSCHGLTPRIHLIGPEVGMWPKGGLFSAA